MDHGIVVRQRSEQNRHVIGDAVARSNTSYSQYGAEVTQALKPARYDSFDSLADESRKHSDIVVIGRELENQHRIFVHLLNIANSQYGPVFDPRSVCDQHKHVNGGADILRFSPLLRVSCSLRELHPNAIIHGLEHGEV